MTAMFYVFQMNDGRFHVDAYTSSPRSARLLAMRDTGHDTREAAEAARQDLVRIWGDARATDGRLTAQREQRREVNQMRAQR